MTATAGQRWTVPEVPTHEVQEPLEAPLIQSAPQHLSSRYSQPGFGYVIELSPLRTMSKEERQTRRIDAHGLL